MECAIAVGYIGPLIWLDSVGSSFIHYIYKVKGYIYCLTGSKANERGCHRYIDYLCSIKPSGDLLIFFFVEISFRRILRILNISPGNIYTALTIRWFLWGSRHLKCGMVCLYKMVWLLLLNYSECMVLTCCIVPAH